MKKSIKIKSLVSLLLITLTCFAVSVVTTKTYADVSVKVDGIYIRANEDEDGKYGMRWSASIADYNPDYEYGFEVIPADLLNDDVDDAVQVQSRAIVPKENSGSYSILVSITDVKAENKSRPYTARAYVFDGVNKVYSDWYEAKSLYTVATQVLADASASFDSETVAELTDIVDTVQGKGGLGKPYYKNDITIDYGDATKGALICGKTFKVNATVKNDNGNVQKAYAQVRITDSLGNEIAGAISQVEGTQDEYTIEKPFNNANIVCTIGSGETAITETVTGNTVKGTVAVYGTGSSYKETGEFTVKMSSDYSDLGYLDFGEYENGGTVTIDFTGKYKPQVAFFATPVSNWTTGNSPCVMFSDDKVGTDYRVWPSTDVVQNSIINYKIQAAGYNNLDAAKSYRLVLSAVRSTDYYCIKITLYTENAGEYVETANCDSSFAVGQIADAGTHIVVYGSRITKVSGKITVKEYVSERKVVSKNGRYNPLAGTYRIEKNADASISYTDVNYIDFGEYANGGTVTLEFTGKYKPQIAFFTDGVTTNMKESVKACFLFTDDAFGTDYRLFPSTAQTGAYIANKINAAGYSNLDAAKSYRLVLSAIKGETNYSISITLYEVGVEEAIATTSANYSISLGAFANFGTHIVMYGSRITAETGTITIE